MTTAHPLETVLVGCGAVAKLYYAPALQMLQARGALAVTGLVDPNGDNLLGLGKVFPAARRCEHVSGAVSLRPRLAIVASPPQHHATQTVELLRAGISVLCEKPMATSATAARAMVEAAAVSSGTLAVGLSRRFFPATQLIRDALRNGIIGDVTSFSFREGGDFNWPVMSGDYFSKRSGRGGVLLDLGIHALDLLLWWWGEPDKVVCEDDAMGGIEANCRIEAQFNRGFGGEIRLSRDWPSGNQYRIQGTRGWLRWDVNEADRIQVGVSGSCYTLTAQLQQARDEGLPAVAAANFHRSFLDQLRDVVEAVRKQKRPRVSGEDALQSLLLVERCQRERTLIEMPWLSAEEQSRAMELGGS